MQTKFWKFNYRGAAAVHKLVEMNSSSDSDEEGQAFYVGGSERSGQQVIGPPRNKGKPSGDLIGDMFKSAREWVYFLRLLQEKCINFFWILDMEQKFWKRGPQPQPRVIKHLKELDIV